MTSTNCENSDHERCERCEGCVPCGCLCHLMPETEGESEPSLTLESMGLRGFQDEVHCTKCGSMHMSVEYHEMIVFALSGHSTPCQEWTQKGLLGGAVGEHLCLRCVRCGYGYPSKTQDSA